MRLANISLEKYLLLRFFSGENCSQNDITEAERHYFLEKTMTLEQIEQERQAFEEFMRSQNNGDRLERDDDGNYADISIDYAWVGWKARAKQTIWK